MRNRIFKTIGGFTIIALILGASIFMITKLANNKKSANIISSNFIGYDFARAVTGDKSEISMLLKPGAEAHDFEPTPEDIINIKNADLFIYVGGESDEWIENLLEGNEIPAEKTLRLMDLVEVKEEELSEGMEEHDHEDHEDHEDHNHEASETHEEYDEHIWTSPLNAIKLVNGIQAKLSIIHPENKSSYTKNSDNYTARLLAIDQKCR